MELELLLLNGLCAIRMGWWRDMWKQPKAMPDMLCLLPTGMEHVLPFVTVMKGGGDADYISALFYQMN